VTRLPTGDEIFSGLAKCTRQFERIDEDHYRMTLAEMGIQFDADRCRRERHQLVGELAVRCELPWARVSGPPLGTRFGRRHWPLVERV
jgi:hypothetical protein